MRQRCRVSAAPRRAVRRPRLLCPIDRMRAAVRVHRPAMAGTGLHADVPDPGPHTQSFVGGCSTDTKRAPRSGTPDNESGRGPPHNGVALDLSKMPGGVLLSHTLPGAVPSALEGLASGFGMRPGVSP